MDFPQPPIAQVVDIVESGGLTVRIGDDRETAGDALVGVDEGPECVGLAGGPIEEIKDLSRDVGRAVDLPPDHVPKLVIAVGDLVGVTDHRSVDAREGTSTKLR